MVKREQEVPSNGGTETESLGKAGLNLEGLHPRVQEVAAALYGDGHYRQAILDVYIALVDEVRRRSGLTDLDNTPLMQRAFSVENPVLVVGEDRDEQLGFMWLYSGAVMGIRNPKAHRLLEQRDPQRALEWLAFASVLFRVLDDARPLSGARKKAQGGDP